MDFKKRLRPQCFEESISFEHCIPSTAWTDFNKYRTKKNGDKVNSSFVRSIISGKLSLWNVSNTKSWRANYNIPKSSIYHIVSQTWLVRQTFPQKLLLFYFLVSVCLIKCLINNNCGVCLCVQCITFFVLSINESNILVLCFVKTTIIEGQL